MSGPMRARTTRAPGRADLDRAAQGRRRPDLGPATAGAVRSDYLDIFNARAPTMVTTIAAAAFGRECKWRKPAALLINGGTRSARRSWLRLQEVRLMAVIGTRSAGALLAAGRSCSKRRPAAAAGRDVAVDGERLEGRGVTPTSKCARVPYAAAPIPSSSARSTSWRERSAADQRTARSRVRPPAKWARSQSTM